MSSILLSIGLVLVLALIAVIVARRIKMPLVAIEVIIGIMLGRSCLKLLTTDTYLDVMANLGLIFLLFLAGLEMGIRRFRRESIAIAIASFITPFILGVIVGKTYGISSILMGTLLSTTSVGIVISVVGELKINEEMKRLILESALIVDALSMFVLTISLEIERGTPYSSLTISSIAIVALFVIPLIISKTRIKKYLTRWIANESHFKQEVRFCLALTIIIAGFFEFLGFHAILGSFLAGLIISEITEEGDAIREKLLGLGYGFFIPFFFIVAGATVNIPLLVRQGNIDLVLLLLLAGMGGKVLGVLITSIFMKISIKIGAVMGILHSARLSLIIAGAKLGLDLGLISQSIYSAITLFALATVLLSPLISKLLAH